MVNQIKLHFGVIAGTLLALGGCGSTPVPDLPEGDVPVDWGYVSEGSEPGWPATDWWQAFDSTELNELVQRLEDSNLDLEINRLNLEQAELTLRDAGFNLLPTPVVSVSASKNYSGTKPDGADYTDGGSESANLSLGITYADILSKPTQYASARASYESSVASAVNTRLNTLATASSTYFQLLLIRDRIAFAEQNVANAETIAKIAQARADAGTITPLDALQQRIAVATQQANLQSLRQSEYSAKAALALMLASSVREFDVSGDTLADVAIPSVMPGLPSSLLVRRPDIVQARSNLVRSTKDVDLARLEFLPNISLTGSANLVSESLSDLLSGADLFVSSAASLAETLLDNGSRLRNVKRSRLALESSLASYRKVVIGAFNDIEVSLSNIELLAVLSQVAAENLDLAEEAFRLAEVRYREGAVGFETVLNAQTTLFNSRNSFLDSKLAQLNAIISLYVALGGGWQEGESPVMQARS